MKLIDYQPRGLTASQQRNLAAWVATIVFTLNDHWPQVTGLIGLHYHGLPVPPYITLAIQIIGPAISALSRALNRGRSGTGTGIIGTPSIDPAGAALVTPSGVLPVTIEAAAATPVTMGEVHALSALYVQPKVNAVLDLALGRLPAPDIQKINAFAARLVAEGEDAAYNNMTQRLQAADLAPAPAVVIDEAPASDVYLDRPHLTTAAPAAPDDLAPADAPPEAQTATEGAAEAVNVITAPPPAEAVAPPVVVNTPPIITAPPVLVAGYAPADVLALNGGSPQ